MKITILFIGAQSINILLQKEWLNQFCNKSNSAGASFDLNEKSTWYQMGIWYRMLFSKWNPPEQERKFRFEKTSTCVSFFSNLNFLAPEGFTKIDITLLFAEEYLYWDGTLSAISLILTNTRLYSTLSLYSTLYGDKPHNTTSSQQNCMKF